MTTSMRGVILTGPGRVEISHELEQPIGEQGEAVVLVQSVGICGTDLSILAGHHPRVRWPLVPGHEILGVLPEGLPSAAGRSDMPAGTRVAVNPLLTCGKCGPCRWGSPNVCSDLGLLGIDRMGGMAEYVAVPVDSLVPIPRDVPDSVAVLAEPLAVSVRAIRRSALRVGDSVAVLGAGPIGLLTALMAHHAGAGRVLVIDVRAGRLELAEQLGFESHDVDLALSSLPDDLAMAVDVTYECTGHPAALASATALTRTQGQIMAVGVPHEISRLDIREINFRELVVVGTRVYSAADFSTAVSALVPLTPFLGTLVGSAIPLSKAAEAYDVALHDQSTVKVILTTSQAA